MFCHSWFSANCTCVTVLLFWPLYILRCEVMTDFCFDGNREGYRLNYPNVLKRLHAKSGPECILLCLKEDECCRSVNYRKETLCGENENCELLHVTAIEESNLLIEDANVDHLVLIQPIRDPSSFNCPESPCQHGGRCIGGCRNKTSVCNCSHSFGGKYCEHFCSNGLRFRGNNTQEYGVHVAESPSDDELSNLTVCFWINTKETKGIYILSYAYVGAIDALLIFMKGNLNIMINGKTFGTNIPLSTGNTHHVCVTWQSVDGHLNVHMDRVVRFNRTGVKTGERIKVSGTWVIGQDQDTVGGRFDSEQAFVGELTEVNVWNRVLSSSEIHSLSSACFPNFKGNYVAYSDFKIKGNVTRFQPSCCS